LVRPLVTGRTKAILVNSPGNPTGAVLPRSQIEQLAEFAIDHDLFVLSDEVYEKFVYGERPHVSVASIDGMRERTVTINSMSKTYAMTGWRIGYAAAPRPLAEAMTKANAASNSCISTVGQYAAIEALDSSQDSVREMIAEFRRRRDLLVSSLNEIHGLSCPMPEGAFYAFPRADSFGMTSTELAMHILEAAHVALIPGIAFGSAGEGQLRLAYANSFERIADAVARIRKTLDSLSARRTND
jgi:aminotransferase